jgi:hypothetical protein
VRLLVGTRLRGKLSGRNLIVDTHWRKAMSDTCMGICYRARAAIDAAYSDVFVNGSKDEFELVFEMELKVYLPENGGQDRKSTWVVQHLMRRGVDGELMEWGRDKKLFGWVGVAAPVEACATFFLRSSYNL